MVYNILRRGQSISQSNADKDYVVLRRYSDKEICHIVWSHSGIDLAGTDAMICGDLLKYAPYEYFHIVLKQ